MAIKALAWMVRSFDAPVYCYHEIVHNQRVVRRFEDLGVVFVDDYYQWDISGSYDINNNLTLFFEGLNLTEEVVTKHGRFRNHFLLAEDSGRRFAVSRLSAATSAGDTASRTLMPPQTNSRSSGPAWLKCSVGDSMSPLLAATGRPSRLTMRQS